MRDWRIVVAQTILVLGSLALLLYAAARTLGIERKTLYRKLESWGVKTAD